MDVHYSQKAVFSFEKGLNCQNQSSSGSLPHSKNSDSPRPPPPPPFPTSYCYLENSVKNLNSKNVQSLIIMGEYRSFGNIF